MSTKEKLQRLIKSGQFDAARKLVKKSNHPKRDQLLARIDTLEKNAKQASKSSKSHPTTAKSAPKSTSTSSSSALSKKPLPLLPEEERAFIPMGRPEKPEDVLKYQTPWRGSASLIASLTGFRAAALAGNFRKLGRIDLFAISILVYFVLLMLQLFAIPVLAGTLQFGFPIWFAFIALVFVALPVIYPYVLVSIQNPVYEKWLEDHHDMLREYDAMNQHFS